MVSRSIAPAAALMAAALLFAPAVVGAPARDEAPATAPEVDAEAVDAVGSALSGRGFPWYDPDADDFRPVTPPRPPRQPWNWGDWFSFELGSLNLQDVGRLIIFVVLAAGLTALVLFIARTWQRRLAAEIRAAAPKPSRVTGSAARFETLPTGLDVDESDPMNAARQLRARGELGRALVMLFAHQLLTLDRLGMIRLAPGRTGRQLVRSIGDEAIRGIVGRTLRMFEAVYYGHEEPDEAAFEALWAEAELLDDALARGVTP